MQKKSYDSTDDSAAILEIFSVSKIIFCNGVIFLLIKIRLLFLWEIAKIMSFVHRFSIRSCSLQKKLGSLTIFAWGYCYCVLRRLWRHLVIKAIATRSLSGSCSRETVTKLDWCYQKFRNHGCVLGWVLFKLRIISFKRSAMSWLGFFPDADNFEPKLATTLTTSNKWEGEDEDDTVKVKYSLPNTLICHNDSSEVYWMYC